MAGDGMWGFATGTLRTCAPLICLIMATPLWPSVGVTTTNPITNGMLRLGRRRTNTREKDARRQSSQGQRLGRNAESGETAFTLIELLVVTCRYRYFGGTAAYRLLCNQSERSQQQSLRPARE